MKFIAGLLLALGIVLGATTSHAQMSIHELTQATLPLTGSEVVMMDQGVCSFCTRQASLNQLKSFMATSGAGSSPTESFPNEGTTGTTAGSIAKINSSGQVLNVGTGDVAAAIGICVAQTGYTCGTTGNAAIAFAGQVACTFDGATTAGDWVIVSTTVAGDCSDGGSLVPTTVQVIGVVLSTNVAGGSYQMTLDPLVFDAALAQRGGVTSVTDGVATLSNVQTLTAGNGLSVKNGTGSHNALLVPSALIAAAANDYPTAATDMGGFICLQSTGHTLTLSAKAAGVGLDMWQAKQTFGVSPCGQTGPWTLTNSSTLPVRGLPGAVSTLASGSSMSLYPMFSGVFAADADQSHIDCVGCTMGGNGQWPEGCATLATTATTLNCPIAGLGTAGTAASVDEALGRGAIFTDIWVNISAAPGAGNVHTFTLMVNGSTTGAPACAINNAGNGTGQTSATTCHGFNGTITGSAGQLAHVADITTGTPVAANAQIGTAWYPTN